MVAAAVREAKGHLGPQGRAAAAAAIGLLTAASMVTVARVGSVAEAAAPASAGKPASCALNSPSGSIKHVISLVFDNVHLTRDNPNVPSDLEQMPNLLNFLKQNGTVLSNMHTPLIAHTANDILTTLTGVYGDKHGQPVANSYGVFNTNGSSSFASSFAYWTDPVANKTTTDTSPTMVNPKGGIAPAPWVPFTRAGCDVGGFSTANIEVENADPDLKSIYGPNSSQWQAVLADEAAHGGFADLSNADYQGIAVHCAKTSGSVCAQNLPLAAPDKLPNEPGGYSGYNALYGNINVGPAIGGTPVSGQGVRVNDLNGQPLTNDFASGDVGKPYYGFPGFTPTAAQSLGYIASMQEHGIPITYGYISDMHDNHTTDAAAGPGDTTYVAQLKAADAAFANFFSRLQNDGITPANTLFAVSTDEGDHLAGTQHPTPAGCDGVTTACTYPGGTLGEVAVNLRGLLKEQYPTETSSDYSIHSDSAPTFYVKGNPAAGTPRARALEHEMASLTAPDPYANSDHGATVPVTTYLADQVEEAILHMKTGDPNRLATFTDFANPDFYLSPGPASCTASAPPLNTSDPCVNVGPAFAWNHGAVGQDINNNWAALAGPGITARGVDSTTWADETDLRPTLMALLGLHDDYVSDGRVLLEDVSHEVLSSTRNNGEQYQHLLDLEHAYKQLNADVGVFGIATLRASTKALESTSPGDATYSKLESQLAALGGQRDALAAKIAAALDGVEFGHDLINSDDIRSWTNQANALMVQAAQLGVAE
jgi:hypothetical protein